MPAKRRGGGGGSSGGGGSGDGSLTWLLVLVGFGVLTAPFLLAHSGNGALDHLWGGHKAVELARRFESEVMREFDTFENEIIREYDTIAHSTATGAAPGAAPPGAGGPASLDAHIAHESHAPAVPSSSAAASRTSSSPSAPSASMASSSHPPPSPRSPLHAATATSTATAATATASTAASAISPPAARVAAKSPSHAASNPTTVARHKPPTAAAAAAAGSDAAGATVHSMAAAESHTVTKQHTQDGTRGVLGTLVCDGVKVEDSEVIYWRDVPGDAQFESPITPHHHNHHERYLAFRYDQGGWNNIRMGIEIVLVAAHAMGRVLVAPPPQRLYLLGKAHTDAKTGRKVNAPALGFEDFFDMDRLRGHQGMHIMSMQEFLAHEAVHGNLKGGRLPPKNQTDIWGQPLWSYLEAVADQKPAWSGKYLAMPASTEHLAADGSHGQSSHFDHPSVALRLKAFAGRRSPVFYDTKLQRAKLLFFQATGGARLLQHHYSFTFFADKKMQSFYKRFIRDFMRYQDVIQCAGHELVKAIRADAAAHHQRTRGSALGNHSGRGTHAPYYALHVRRGDFQFKEVKISAEEIVKNLGGNAIIPRGAIVYVSTDDPKGICENCLYQRKPCPKGEKARGIPGCIVDPSWTAFRDNGWEVRFLGDYLKQGVLRGVNPNFYGMVESIVCSRADKFAGTWWSTFTGYIHRLRGYHGLAEETYYHSPRRTHAARSEESVGHGFTREFRAGWTDDNGHLV